MIERRFFDAAEEFYSRFRSLVGRIQYRLAGRVPWAFGYPIHREVAIRRALGEKELLKAFADGEELPRNFGIGLDERIVEYAWLISRLRPEAGRLLDAGSCLNHKFLLSHEPLCNRSIVCYTLAPERYICGRPNVSYVYGDLRSTILADRAFAEIACISTLEHVGMDNTRFYCRDEQFRESDEQAYLGVVRELGRLVSDRGRIYITVPFGRYGNHGWFQQFDAQMVRSVCQAVSASATVDVFRYKRDGWQRSTLEDSAECEYFDIHAKPRRKQQDLAAAARAVACIQLSEFA